MMMLPLAQSVVFAQIEQSVVSVVPLLPGVDNAAPLTGRHPAELDYFNPSERG